MILIAGSRPAIAGTGRVRAFLGSRLVFAFATISLVAAGFWLGHELKSLRAHQQRQAEYQTLAELHGKVRKNLAGWDASSAALAHALKDLASQRELPEQWTRRTLSIENQAMSRAEADRYFAGLSRTRSSVSLPSAVNVRVAKPTDSVFVDHQGLDGPAAVIVTIKAEQLSKGAQ